MRVAVITPRVPEPNSPYAGGQYVYHRVLDMLSAGHDVFVLAPERDGNPNVNACPVPVHLFPCADRTRLLAPNLRQIWEIATIGMSSGGGARAGFRDSEECWNLLETVDIVEVHYAQTLTLVPELKRRLPDMPIAMIEIDIFTQGVRRTLSVGRVGERLKSLVRLPAVVRNEPKLLSLCDIVAVFKDQDAAYLRDMGVRAPTVTLAPWLTVPAKTSMCDSSVVLFVGAFDRPANTDGAKWLLNEIWEHVVAEIPNASLVFAGAAPPAWLQRLNSPSIHVTGFVPDLEPYYLSAALAVAPLRQGAGLKFKVPQAMVYGLPVVSTTVGAEGVIRGDPRECPIRVADTAEAFALALIDLLKNDDARRLLGTASRDYALRTFNFAQSSATLTRQMEELISQKSSRIPASEV